MADAALKVDPQLSSAYAAKAQALLAQGDTRQAQAMIDEALKRNPVSLPALTTQLNLSMGQGKTQAEIQRLQALAQQHPQNAGLRFLLGLGYFNLNDLRQSEANLTAALKIDPATPQAHTVLANIYLTRGLAEEATREFRAAIDVEPRNVNNYLALANQYEREAKWADAIKLCEKAREIDPASPLAANQLAYLYLEHGGDSNTALALAQQAKRGLPQSPHAADTLGWAYYKAGMMDSAIPQFKQCLQATPDNPACRYHLGMAYLAAGNSSAAERILRQVAGNDQSPYAHLARQALAKATQKPH